MDKTYPIRSSDRVFVVGTTGSGKTTLVKAILWRQSNVVVCDPKRTFSVPAEWPSMYVFGMSELRRSRHVVGEVRIYRPTFEELKEKCEDFFQWVYEEGNIICYVDEVSEVTTPTKIPDGYARCMKLGRELGIGMWSATQRPARIPLEIMTESEHFFIFQLRNPDDRKRVTDYTDAHIATRNPTGHGYWYFNSRDARHKPKYYGGANVGKILAR